MRLRVSELLQRHEMTAYGLAKASGGRISIPTAYRLARDDFKTISSDVLDALCDVFGIDDPGPLFEREEKSRKRK